jgi:hypothetical protein
MSVAVTDYTDAAQMLANYARIRAGFRPPAPVVFIPVKALPEPEPEPEPVPEKPKVLRARPDYATPNTERAKVKRIIRETAERHGLRAWDITGPGRFANYVAARMEACWLAALETDVSLNEIGRLLDKDHTTVIHAVRTMNDRMGTNVRKLGGVPSKRKAAWGAILAKRGATS